MYEISSRIGETVEYKQRDGEYNCKSSRKNNKNVIFILRTSADLNAFLNFVDMDW